MKKVKSFITDAETGEIIGEVYRGDVLSIKRKKDTKPKKAKEDYQKKRIQWEEFEKVIDKECGSFYFNFFMNGLYDLQIKESIKVRFLYLLSYTKYSNQGSYLVHDNNKLMTKQDIFDKLNLSEKEFTRTLKTLLDAGLLIKENDYYLANTYLATRGEITSKQKQSPYTRIFDEGIRSLYENCTSRQHKQLYYLFRLLPYVSLKFNAICKNPSEELVEKVIPLKLKEICEIVGYNSQNSSKFKREMYQLKIFNQYAMLGIECGKGIWYKVNPRLLYAGTNGHLNEFVELLNNDFKMKAS